MLKQVRLNSHANVSLSVPLLSFHSQFCWACQTLVWEAWSSHLPVGWKKGCRALGWEGLRQEIWLQQAVFRQQLKHNPNHNGLPGGQTHRWLVGLLA